MRIVWIGCHDEGIKAFAHMLQEKKDVCSFITLDDDNFKKRSAGSREYIDLCDQYNIPIEYISSIKNEDAYLKIKRANPDLLIVLGWSEILPECILNIPTIGTVGAHASLLPHGRGSAPINWSIIKNEKITGNTLMWLSKEVDQGDIIDQMSFDITNFDTCKTLYDKVADTNDVMLLNLINRLENNQEQSLEISNVTDEPLLPRRRPKDGLIDWAQSSLDVYNLIRAVAKPYPGAFSFLNEKKWLIWSASLLPNMENFDDYGQILGSVYSPVLDACGIMVKCGSGYLVIHEIEDENGNCYKGEEIVNLNLIGRFVKSDNI